MRRTLVYKRTHESDPCEDTGEFGCRNCMGRVRSWPFQAVIGVGGVGKEPSAKGIAGLVTWIGIYRHDRYVEWWPDPIVTFDHFWYKGQGGPCFREEAPVLSERIYGNNIRATMTFSEVEEKEITKLLALAAKAPPSRALAWQTTVTRTKRGRSTHC